MPVADIALRRLTLTRMLIWAAREAREIDCPETADQVELALESIAESIRRQRHLRSV
jgi:hypothetical protein